MTLGELKQHFEGFDDGAVFNFSLSEPFSWRGVYAEVAFSILKESSSKEKNIEMVDKALTETFVGWKGGNYRYNENTSVNFEASEGAWTDGDYAREMISEIEGSKYFFDEETKLVNLAFS